ncbi:ISL3 family transposase [Streptomyces sp. WMMC940]|uniref:ISL3 family transposase n=1 Tax=Streptomyces sp. WMMC940 TaxID=3015153 RepID=UPI0022B64EFE|nr:ISL3 family transposase [Streptomyces sp. WMMC940]MCZ7458246.1 ISL3 family transposase [Streptomyces sp. WMMC940]
MGDEHFWDLVWPDVEGLVIDAVGVVGDAVWIDLRSQQKTVMCPSCGVTVSRVHSTYVRRLADRPLGGRRVLLRLRIRRFFCDNGLCSRRTTAEQVPSLTTRYRRRTTALARMVQAIGLAVGGRAGARLAGYLPVRTSRDVILRELRRLPDPPSTQVTVLGIDEFAFRKGATYGTVLIDVETRRPIDLLPDRTAGTVAAWLADHPEIEVICRDRCSTFSQAAARAAPDAIQVADRWHLLHSLARAVERTAHQHRACLRKDAETGDPDHPEERSDPAALASLIAPPEPNDPPDSQLLARVRQWHTDIHQLRERGWTISAIARRLGRDRKTVRHYLTTDLDQILASARERRPNGHINRFKPYLQHRFRGGATNAAALFREIRERGYRGSRVVVTKYIATLRAGTAAPEPPRPIPSPRRITTWIMRHPDTLTDSQRDQLNRILDACPDLATARDLAHEFSTIAREPRGQDLTHWMTRALDQGPPPVQGFASFLQNDWDAVVNGLTLPWSSGAVEGQVTRIKLIKRRSYGRASFALLRTLVLAQPP